MEWNQWYQAYEAQWTVLQHFCLALVLGGIIGFERELKKRPAGFRTHMLVAAMAALLTDIATLMVHRVPTEVGLGDSILHVDPVRVIVAIATGISFLGAGTIFRSADGVSGLTTAATLLMAAALGITVAVEQYVLAVGATLIVLLVVTACGALEKRLSSDETDASNLPLSSDDTRSSNTSDRS